MENNKHTNSAYPSYEEHQVAWENLSRDIATSKNKVLSQRSAEENPKAADNTSVLTKGQLTVIGTGIENIGISIGDEQLLKAADKVLYCVADPATQVWLKRLRPDALDLYVLYGEDKIRYTTYMQMTEAQLYWVRQGFNVVVVFYGHPGVFVLSTHRAVLLAREEGHRATMKAGVCALDTLSADLGVDPCHPGLQTHEATDCLVRRRHIDPTLHVILWQVGLIGELGFRRQGYLNEGFPYFIDWLIELYGPEYKITHYIGSRYPTIEPLIEVYALKDLHNPEVQSTITGISTFYIPPRDIVPTDAQTARDLGLLKDGQKLVIPKSPLRDIGQYGQRELKAFKAFKTFSIPKSYSWQEMTPGSNFLIELRYDVALQKLYQADPLAALDDPRFQNLSDKERSLLASRDSGAIQVAARGAYKRSPKTEELIHHILGNKKSASTLLDLVQGHSPADARATFSTWSTEQGFSPEWAYFQRSLDFIYSHTLYPWTGVYLAEDEETVITLVGHKKSARKSVLYVNDTQIKIFQFGKGALSWSATDAVPFHGVIRLDLTIKGNRRLVCKTWLENKSNSDATSFTALEVGPERSNICARLPELTPQKIHGVYCVASSGGTSRQNLILDVSDKGVFLNEEKLHNTEITQDSPMQVTLKWTDGLVGDFTLGELSFLSDPILGSVDVYGTSKGYATAKSISCYGARQITNSVTYQGPKVPPWAGRILAAVCLENATNGGLLLWHKWEKADLGTITVAKVLSQIV